MIFLSKNNELYRRDEVLFEHSSLPIITDKKGNFINYDIDTYFKSFECLTTNELGALLEVDNINKYFNVSKKIDASLYIDEDGKFYMMLDCADVVIDCQTKEIFSNDESNFISFHDEKFYHVVGNKTSELKRLSHPDFNLGKFVIIDTKSVNDFEFCQVEFLNTHFFPQRYNVYYKNHRMLELKNNIVAVVPKHSVVLSKIGLCESSYIVMWKNKYYYIDENGIVEFNLDEFSSMQSMSFDVEESKIPLCLYEGKFLFGEKRLFEIDFETMKINLIAENVLHKWFKGCWVLFDENKFIIKLKM